MPFWRFGFQRALQHEKEALYYEKPKGIRTSFKYEEL